jgi:mono/diheme cytochrome c family protein
MKKFSTPFYPILLMLAAVTANAQTKTVKQVPFQPASTSEGVDLFTQHCAVCHGKDGKGAGPAAEAWKKAPADLTQIARRNNGTFPDLKVEEVIEGLAPMAVHGTREMPMWGTLLGGSQHNEMMGKMRVYALMKYIEQIQAK